MESSLELIFSYGRFQCLGKNLAMMELNKIFVEVRTVYDEAYSLRMNQGKSTASSAFRFQNCVPDAASKVGLPRYFLPEGDVAYCFREKFIVGLYASK
jgi:hypothetical protein